MSTHQCPRCGTEYFRDQECDWCPGVAAVPLPPVETRLARAEAFISQIKLKAEKWDALMMIAHRYGTQIAEVIRAVNERVNFRRRR